MLVSDYTLSGILLASGKITANTLKSVLQEDVIDSYSACQRLIDLGFIAEEELLKILGAHFGYPYAALKNVPEKNLFLRRP